MKTGHMRLACAALLGGGTLAAGQSVVLVEIDRPVLRAGEVAVVTLRAGFPLHLYAMATIELDVELPGGVGGWSDWELVKPMDGPFTSAGAPAPAGIVDIVARQLHFPPAPTTDPSNPIAFWRATYTAPLAPRSFDVSLATTTRRYDVYIDYSFPDAVSQLHGLVEGSGLIRVIGCYADCDGSGELDLFDFLCFQNMFAAGDLYADCDESGALDLFDFLCFQNEFAAGCP
ncbi:MAG: GC-type dockerin domain-anchored protein [Phycisphaerales bacterium JB039]